DVETPMFSASLSSGAAGTFGRSIASFPSQPHAQQRAALILSHCGATLSLNPALMPSVANRTQTVAMTRSLSSRWQDGHAICLFSNTIVSQSPSGGDLRAQWKALQQT